MGEEIDASLQDPGLRYSRRESPRAGLAGQDQAPISGKLLVFLRLVHPRCGSLPGADDGKKGRFRAIPAAGGIVYMENNNYKHMPGKKEVTIGITVNLENYENLRLEVEGDVETHEDVDDLIMFLDGMLARLGRGDPATAERVDAYRRRVLKTRPAEPQAPAARPVPEREPAGTAAVEPAHRQEEAISPPVGPIEAAIPPAPPRVLEPPAQPEKKASVQPEVPRVLEPPAQPEKKVSAQPEPPRNLEPPVQPEKKASVQPEAARVQAPQQETPTAKPPGAPADDVCEICGAEVTKSQAKLSQLFMSKKLCKKCMEHP